MKVAQKVHGKLGIRLWTRSVNYVANEVHRTWLELVNLRGLPVDYLVSRRQLLTDGLYTWLSLRKLKRTVMELSDSSGNVVERWDMQFSYDTTASDSEHYQTSLDRLTEAAGALSTLPPETQYRVLVDLEPDAPKVPGWGSSRFGDISHLQSRDLGGVIDTARIGMQMVYYG